MQIRAYETKDRPGVRAVCCDTANLGDPIDIIFPDRQTLADLLSSYYTDYEPQAIWVVEDEGKVEGYLTGCLDFERYQRAMRWRIVPRTALNAALHGLLIDRATWRLFRAAAQTLQLGGWPEPQALKKYPAHLHMNLRPHLRGKGLGQQLLENFLAYASSQKVPGVCAAVRSDNAGACRFFQHQGFRELYRHPIVLPRGIADDYAPHERIVYAKSL